MAHKEIDLKNPSSNRRNAGFTDEEREKFQVLLDSGFQIPLDIFTLTKRGRVPIGHICLMPGQGMQGWRIDYFCVSKRLEDKLIDAQIHEVRF